MDKIYRRVVTFTLAILMLFGSLPFEALNMTSTVQAATTSTTGVNVGKVTKVVQTINNTDTLAQYCKRVLEGQLTLNWPNAESYVDVVIIQDFSGSFDDTIDEVATAVRDITSSLDFGFDKDGSSPKDRVMFVGFQGSEGMARVSSGGVVGSGSGYTAEFNNYDVASTPLYTSKTSVDSYITTNYTAANTVGGTPTVDGMRLAQSAYQNATIGTAPYNNTTYTVNGEDRKRETIYLLITDGVANTAKYSNLPQVSRDMFNFYAAPNSPYIPGNVGTGMVAKTGYYYSSGGYWYYTSGTVYVSSKDSSLAKVGSTYYYGGFYGSNGYYYLGSTVYNPGSPTTSYNWSDWRNPDAGVVYRGSDGYYYEDRRESYRIMLDAMQRISGELQVDGGLDKGDAKVVSAFWENTAALSTYDGGGYGVSGWLNMKDTVINLMKGVSSGGYFATSDNIDTFTKNLVQVFKESSSSMLQEIEVDFDGSLIPNINDIHLYGPNGSEIFLSRALGDVRVEGNKLYIDMTGRPAGDYRVTYKATEQEFMPNAYQAITDTKFIIDTNTYSLAETNPTEVSKLTVEGNTKTDCDIDVSKFVTTTQADYYNGTTYKELAARRQEFYYDTKYTFTGKVQDVKSSMVLSDLIDPRLEVLDVFLVAADDFTKVDAVSSATPNGTLIAEDNPRTAGLGNITVGTRTASGTQITYNLPKQPKTINGTSRPFAGYEGKTYTLVVKVRILDSVTDAQIEAMRSTVDTDGKAVGIPNVSKIILDGTPTDSNKVKAVPPGEYPKLDKKVNGEDETTITNLTDNLNYTMDITVPQNTRDITKIHLRDEFLPIFKLGNTPTVKVVNLDGTDNADLTAKINRITDVVKVTGQVLELLVPDAEADQFANTKIIVTLDASIDPTKSLADYLVEGKLPNTATLSFTNDPTKDIEDTAKVTPPKEDPTPVKDVDGEKSKNLGSVDQTFTYHINANVPADVKDFTKYVLFDNLENVLETSLDRVVVRVNGNEDSHLKSFVTYGVNPAVANSDANTVVLNIPLAELKAYAGKHIEVAIGANIVKGADLSGYADNTVPNDATLSITDDPNTDLKTEVVPVTPPNDEQPTITKEVAKADGTGKSRENLNLGTRTEAYRYYVNVVVPANTNGFTKFIIEDKLESVLEIGTVQVELSDGTAYEGPQATLDNTTNTVKLDLSTDIKDYAGKTVSLVINANIKNGADLSKYVGEVVPNKATLNFNDKPMESNEVTVTPPGTTPDPKKDVNGKPSENLGLKTQEFTYNVWADIPSNVTGYTKLNLTDNLEDVLEVVSTKVTLAGVEDTTLTQAVKVTTDGTNVVTLDITEGFDKLAGKRINLAITAKVKADADLSGYVNNEIPNKATLTLNDNPAKETDNVPVIPPNDETPTIEKTVGTNDGATGNNMSKDELKLDALTSPYIYHVDVKVPTNITGYEQIKIEDTLEAVLTLGDVKILVDNTEDTNLTGKVVKNGNTASFELNNTTDPTVDFKEYAGKTITMVINAKITDGADLSKYINGSVPNTATLTFNNKPSTSNEVLVTPPGEEPKLDKKVNGSDDVTIANLKDNLSYTMDITVPMNTKDITKIVLEDTFLPIFKLADKADMKVSVMKAGAEDPALSAEALTKLSLDGQKVSLQIVGATEANKYAGTTITVTVPATIDTTKNLADYLVAGALPNTATLSYTNDPTKDIKDEAKVTPPGEDPTPKKDVNGQDRLVLGSLEQLYTYHVNATVPSDIKDFTKYVLSDNLEDILVATQAKVKVNGLEDATLTGLVKIESDGTVANNLVTLDIPMETLANYKGKNIELSIEARIKDGVTASELAKYVTTEDPAGSIPNTANLALTDNPDEDKKSNTVPVTPPDGDTPDISKTVNDVSEFQLTELKEVHTYKVTSNIPANTTGYQKVVIADNLEDILEATSVKVLVDGTELTADQIASYGSLVNNNGDISYTIDKNFDQLAGKAVTIVIEAKVSDSATPEQLKPYLNQGFIPNRATMTFNDGPAKEAEVKILPPPEKPELDKKVNGSDEVTIANLTDSLTYTMDITVPETTRDITKIVLEDTFLPIFKLSALDQMQVSVKRAGTEDTTLTASAKAGLTVNGQTVSLQIVGAEEANKYAGTTITVTVPATIDTTKNLADYLVEGALPNTATLSYNNDPTKDLKDEAKVTPPGEDPTPKKDVDGKPSLVLGAQDQVFTYHINATVPSDVSKFTKYVLTDDLEDILTITGTQVKVNGVVDTKAETKLTVGANNLVTLDLTDILDNYKGKNIEVSIQARIKDGVTAAELAAYVTAENPTGSIPNIANLALTDNPDEDKKTENVPVTPPDGDSPQIDKEVGKAGGEFNKDNLDLMTLTEDYQYKVNVTVPANVTGYKSIVVEDILETVLLPGTSEVLVDGTKNDTLTGKVKTEGQNISLEITDNFQAYAGKTITLVINANIRDKADLSGYADNKVPNTATLTFNDNPAVDSNTVTVTPPGPVPTPIKTINGEDQGNTVDNKDTFKLGTKDQRFFYDVRVEVPENVNGYESFVITDSLKPELDTSLPKITVYVNDIVNADLKKYVNYDGTDVTLTIDNKIPGTDFDFKQLAGKTVRLSIEANFKSTVTDADLAKYIVAPSTDVVVPNTADLKINDTSKSSNTVNVTPPGDEPTVEKTVETKTVEASKEKVLLTAKDETFTYKVNVAVPKNVEGYTSIKLEDNLEDVLEIVGTPKVVLSDNSTYQGPAPVVDGTDTNKVSLDIRDNFAAYAGKTITLVIDAKIKADVTSDQIAYAYGESSIPNKATLTFNGDPKDSNEVLVTPPGETPTPVKDVNAQSDVTLTKASDEFVYNVRYTIPTNITGFEKLVMTDTLEKVLTTAKDRITVYVDDKKDDNLTNAITVTDPADPMTAGQTIKLETTKGFATFLFGNAFEGLAGKTIRVEIKANIKDNADLSAYTDNKVPNKATLELNDSGKAIPSETVYVAPPKGDVILTKLANGQPLKDGQEAKFGLFKQAGAEPADLATGLDTEIKSSEADGQYTVNATDKKQISVKDLEVGNYYFVETVAPVGLMLNDTPIKFAITADQDQSVALTWNNVTPETPVPEKKVNGQDHLDLSKIEDKFTYTVTIPTDNTNGWSKLAITDQVDSQLTVDPSTVKVTLGDQEIKLGDVVNDVNFTLENNLITFNLNNPARAQALVGKTVVLTFDATITNIESFLEAHPNAIVGNTADLDIGNGAVPSNEVTVTPPGDTPTPHKDVNGKTEEHLGKIDQEFVYNVYFDVPTNVTGFTKINLTDDLEDVLEVKGTQVTVGGVPNADLTGKVNVSINGSVVKLDITDGFDQLAGKRVNLAITAKVKDGADLSEYENNTIPNQATLTLNDDPNKSNKTEIVPVTPPNPNEPGIEKTVSRINGSDTTTGNLDLAAKTDKFIYHVNTDVPKNTNGFTQIKLEDTLEDVLKVEKARVLVDGVEDTGLIATIAGQTVTTEITSDFAKYAGKTISLEITASIIEGADLRGYVNQVIPNESTLTFNGNPKTSNKVTVTPPGETPTPVKDVNGKESHNLAALGEEFTYNVKAQVPTNVTGYEKLVLKDKLNDVLEVVSTRVEVDGQVASDLNAPVIDPTDKQMVVLTIGNGYDFTKLAGKTVNMVIVAKVKAGADLSGLVDNSYSKYRSIELKRWTRCKL